MTEISVIVASRNAAATLAETLEGLCAQEWDGAWEIVLADNGSTDDTVAIFRDYADRHPGIPMWRVDAGQRRGKSHALNVGIRAARGAALLFCDADDVPAPGWLAAMARALERHAFVAARMDFAGLNSGWVLDYRTNPQLEGLGRINFPPHCLHAGGGTFGFRRSVFETVGDFDPALLYLEDTDYCIRAYLRGIAPHFVPDALIHVRFRSASKAIYRQSYNYARYRMLLRKRYDPDGAAGGEGWLRLGGHICRLMSWRLSAALRGRGQDALEQARFQRRFGKVMGTLAGALRYRAQPL